MVKMFGQVYFLIKLIKIVLVVSVEAKLFPDIKLWLVITKNLARHKLL